jgi:hypothetical protein
MEDIELDFHAFPIDLYSTESFPRWEREYLDHESNYHYATYRMDGLIRISYGIVRSGRGCLWYVRASRFTGEQRDGADTYRVVATMYERNSIHPAFAITQLLHTFATG